MARWSAFCVAMILVIVLGALPATGAPSDGLTLVPENGSPGLLSLTSGPYPAEFRGLTPGDVVWWQVGAHLRDREVGALFLRVESAGELVTMPRGIVIDARVCSEPWADADLAPFCAGTSLEILSEMPLVDVPAHAIALGDIDPNRSRWLLFSIGLPADTDAELQGREGRFYVELTASGDTPNAPPGSPPGSPHSPPFLPLTGAPTRVLVAVGLAALAVGLTFTGAARRRTRATS